MEPLPLPKALLLVALVLIAPALPTSAAFCPVAGPGPHVTPTPLAQLSL